MIRKIFYFITIALFSFKTIAQQNVSIGPVIGLNYSTVSNNSAAEFKAGFVGGIFANYSTKTDFGFNGSLIFSQLGNNVENSDNYLTLNYLQVPINLVYYFGEGMREGSFRPKLFIGPYIGYLVSAKSPGFSNEQTVAFFNNLDYGANIGAGFNYAIKNKTWLNVDLKYGSKFQNRTLSLTAGISFPLGTYDKKTGKMK
jgi:hypothetical protein